MSIIALKLIRYILFEITYHISRITYVIINMQTYLKKRNKNIR